MPNHIHMILSIKSEDDGRPMVAPTISSVIGQTKGHITKQAGYSIWQKLYHDHVVRGERDYTKIWEYIENNSANWVNDCFYCE